MSYHHYCPVPSGGLHASKEGTYDAIESKAAGTQVQRASASSFVKSTLHPKLSTSRSVFNSGKCNMVAINTEQEPQRTPLACAASIQPWSNSTSMDIGAAKEDGPLALPSTKSQTRAAEVRTASSSASASHRVASSTLIYPIVLSRQSSSQARPGGSLRSRS
jgi:hypothetical protein